mmetsp:Transcript_6822/g.19727  ORF Transcript_6822/g.19727 Transcript_6822/m.19727 type:complete len:462 (-) Transcript_6822:1656-3041(-)
MGECQRLSLAPSPGGGTSDRSPASAGKREEERQRHRAAAGLVGRPLCGVRTGAPHPAPLQGKPAAGHDAHAPLGRPRNRPVSAETGADPADGDESLAPAAVPALGQHRAGTQPRRGGGPNRENQSGTLRGCRRIAPGVHLRSAVGIVDAGGRQPVRPVGLLQLAPVVLVLVEKKGVPQGRRSAVQARRFGPHGCGGLVPAEIAAIPVPPGPPPGVHSDCQQQQQQHQQQYESQQYESQQYHEMIINASATHTTDTKINHGNGNDTADNIHSISFPAFQAGLEKGRGRKPKVSGSGSRSKSSKAGKSPIYEYPEDAFLAMFDDPIAAAMESTAHFRGIGYVMSMDDVMPTPRPTQSPTRETPRPTDATPSPLPQPLPFPPESSQEPSPNIEIDVDSPSALPSAVATPVISGVPSLGAIQQPTSTPTSIPTPVPIPTAMPRVLPTLPPRTLSPTDLEDLVGPP